MSPSTARFLVGALLFLGTAASAQTPTFSKAFAPSTIGAGSTSRLTFSVTNVTASPVDNIAFSDTLPAGMVIASPAQAVTTFTTAILTAPAGGTTITLTGGRLGGNATETVTVDVVGSTVGALMNVSGDLTSDAGNSGPASATLTVAADRPGFSKSFSPSTISFGGTSTLTFTFDNTANAATADGMSFSDLLPVGMEVASPPNVTVTCPPGFGGPAQVTAVAGTNIISMFNGAVAANSTCTISVDVTTSNAGTLTNESGELNVQFPVFVTCGFATAQLTTSTPAPGGFGKFFTNDPVGPGGTVDLQYTIQNMSHTDPLTGISFTDDFDAALSGLVATGLPINDICGPGSQLSGTSVLTLTGGNLAAEESCVFTVTLQVPPGAAPGSYPSTTSTLTATGGVTVNPASDTLSVAAVPTLTKTFLSNPVEPGDSVSIEFTVTNNDPTFAATDIAFSDNLGAFMSGAIVTGLPAPGFCGPSSFMSSFTVLDEQIISMTGGSLAANDSCTFSVTFQVPSGTGASVYTNTTDPISATINGATLIGPPATDDLEVVGGVTLLKTFIDDPVFAGGTATLRFQLTYPNEDALSDATAISFTDDLDATLSGLVATGLPANGVCGPGSTLSGTSVISLTGGQLSPGETCIIDVTLQVPGGAAAGSYLNTTSVVSSTVGGIPVTEPAASDSLIVTDVGIWTNLRNGLPGTDDNVPKLQGFGNLLGNDSVTIFLQDALPNALATFFLGVSNISAPFKGGILVPSPDIVAPGLPVAGNGTIIFGFTWPPGIGPGISLYYQYWVIDPEGIRGLSASNGLQSTTP